MSVEILTVGQTVDLFLGGQIKICQPAEGYRAAIDPVILAASLDVKLGDRVLDVGAGHGTAAICLAHRVPGCTVVGIEIQSGLAELANHNASLNGLSSRVEVIAGDLIRPPVAASLGDFDHVMANPPYLICENRKAAQEQVSSSSNFEGEAALADWFDFMLRMIRPKGTITLIHRADRLDEILSLMFGRVGEIIVFPVWPRYDVAAKRVLVRARKGVRTPMTVSAGLVMHEEGGNFTPVAEKILCGGPNAMGAPTKSDISFHDR